MTDLTTLLTGENAGLIGAIVVVLSTAKAVIPKILTRPKVKRFIPLAPVILGIIATYLGFGTAGDALATWQSKLILGCLAGFTAGQLYKAGKTSIFGWGLIDQAQQVSVDVDEEGD
jgi:hypothetical protein